jgi:hypothetical protein
MKYTSTEYKVTDSLSALAFASWSFAVWLLAFKYWQTAYEMNYLFRIHDDKLISKKTSLYKLLNGTALILTLAAVICTVWVDTPEFTNIGTEKLVSASICYTGVLLTVSLLIDAIRRL